MRFIKKVLLVLLFVIIATVIVYLLGSKIERPIFSKTLPEIPADILSIDNWINERESRVDSIKRNNQAQIIWHKDEVKATDYSIVYLHGFGASHQEGYPVHKALADSLNANMYLARQSGHGLTSKEAFRGLDANAYMLSAMEALSIGRQLGEKVIVMGTSTGAAQAIWLAANFPDAVEALILYSPYISLRNPINEKLVLGPWGKTITKWVMGSEINYESRPDSVSAYWSEYYHIDAYFALFSLIEASMTEETFRKVKCPTFMAYYYKDETNQDQVVSVSAMLDMFSQLSSEDKKSIAFPNSGNHVIASDLRSKDWVGVQDSSWVFIEDLLLQ